MDTLVNVIAVLSLGGIAFQVVGMPGVGMLLGGLAAVGFGDTLANGGRSSIQSDGDRGVPEKERDRTAA